MPHTSALVSTELVTLQLLKAKPFYGSMTVLFLFNSLLRDSFRPARGRLCRRCCQSCVRAGIGLSWRPPSCYSCRNCCSCCSVNGRCATEVAADVASGCCRFVWAEGVGCEVHLRKRIPWALLRFLLPLLGPQDGVAQL